MQLSKEWILSDYLNQTDIQQQDFLPAMAALGHQITIHENHWRIESPVNRPDCHSVVGIAREFCTALAVPFRYQAPVVEGCEEASIFEMLDVDVWDEQLCNRLTCRMAYNIRNCPSPDWLQSRLLACGITPVNCITDIAKYAELELGQPLLILDGRCSSGSLTLRQSFPGESQEEAVVLAGDFQPITIGGTICAEEALLRPDTNTIIICAIHNNDSSCDSMLTYTAVERMCQLIETTQCGTVADGTIDILNYVPHECKVPLTLKQINNQLNTAFTEKTLSALLQPTGIIVADGEFVIPPHRQDLLDLQDIMEEILRILAAQKDKHLFLKLF